WSAIRRVLNTTNATPKKYSSEGAVNCAPRTLSRIADPPQSAITTYERTEMEKITKASVISRVAVADSAKPDIFDNLIKSTTAVCLTGDVCADAAGPFSARVELASGGPSLRN